MPHADEIYAVADELRSIANMGLHYAVNDFDAERYRKVLTASARLVAALEQRQVDEVLDVYLDNLGHFSPQSGADAAAFRDGKLLLIKRHDNGLWALPGGLVEVGETLAETAQRELWEETGVSGRVLNLLGIFDSRLWGSRVKGHYYATVFLVDPGDGVPHTTAEALDVGFFAEDALPDLSPGHHRRVPLVFKLHRGEIPVPYFDAPAVEPDSNEAP